MSCNVNINVAGSTAGVVVDATESSLQAAKPAVLTSVYCWGSGMDVPSKLPLPSSDTRITQVATGRTQKAAVTKNRRLLVWEVSPCNLLSHIVWVRYLVIILLCEQAVN